MVENDLHIWSSTGSGSNHALEALMHVHTLTPEDEECLRGCSQYAQYYRGRKSFEDGRCVFCQIDRNANTVLYEQQEWIGWEVPPSFTTRIQTLSLQLLLFPKRHLRGMFELNEQEQKGFFSALAWADKRFDLHGGGIISRFGDMRFNVGTIKHMHVTIMVPNRRGEVIVPLQKSPEMWAEHDVRMKEFALRYEAGEQP